MEESIHKESIRSTETSSVISFWKTLDLDSKKAVWDKTYTELREQKTNSINGRKRLNDLTKAYRARSKEDQLVSMAELLKAYQEEIDQLSRRAKVSEAAFLGVYKLLYDAPDPSLCMEQLVNNALNDSAQALEIERLRGELRHYDEEFQQLKNQDITIRRLEDQLEEFKENMEAQVVAEVERRLVDLQTECKQRIQEAQEQQYSAEKRCQLALESAKQAQFMADRVQAQLFESSNKFEERISGLLTEKALLAETTQRLQESLAEAQAKLSAATAAANAHATATAASSNGGVSASGSMDSLIPGNSSQSQSSSLTAYEHLISRLTEDLRVLQGQYHVDKMNLEKTNKELQGALQAEQAKLTKLQQEMQHLIPREVVAKLHHQIRLLQKVAFQKTEEDLDLVETTSSLSKKGGSNRESREPEEVREEAEAEAEAEASSSLEDLLVQRIQVLDQELTAQRIALAESKQQESTLRSTVDTLRLSLSSSEDLIRKLEVDVETRSTALEKLLAQQQQPSSSYTDNMSVAGNRSQMEDLVMLLDGSPSSSSSSSSLPSSAQQAVAGPPSSSLPTTATAMTVSQDVNQQMIVWLQSQRDKYKERLGQAEAQCLRVQQQYDSLQTKYAQLEHDNLSLFQRIQRLTSGAESGRPVGMAGNRNYRLEEGRFGDDSEVDGRYAALYEQRMGPFNELSYMEKQRKLRELSVADRIVLNTTMAIISNHAGRSFLLVYLGLMHALVFFVMYYAAHNVSHGCDPALDHVQAHALLA